MELFGLASQKSDYGLDVMDLGGPLGIEAGTVIGTDYGIASLEQCRADRVDVGHALAAVAEPGTAIDVHYDGKLLAFELIALGEIDVKVVIFFAIANIVDVAIDLAAETVCTIACYLPTTKAEGALGRLGMDDGGEGSE